MSLSDGLIPPPPLPPVPPTHGFLGIALSADPERHTDGVEIMSVSPGGAAAEAGLKPGDVLVEIDGKKLARDGGEEPHAKDRKSTRLNSSHVKISYAVFCLKKTKDQDAQRKDDEDAA